MPWRWEPGPPQLRRQSVATQAQELIGGACLTLDTETIGVGYDAEICEIAILNAACEPILDTLVRPTRPIPAEATAIHGITDDMVATAPSWPEVADQYAALIADRTVVAYNAAFDVRLLRHTHQIHALTAPLLKTACAMLMHAAWRGDYDRGSHRAIADARMTLGCCATSGNSPMGDGRQGGIFRPLRRSPEPSNR